MSARGQPLIVGAGPAGVRAAETLAKAGLKPRVVDEAPACGGQIYRQRLVEDGRSATSLYGSEAAKATRLHRDFAALASKLDYWPNALVWNLSDGVADVAVNRENRRLAYDGLILATGAMDRVLPLPGWTLPGVFTLGGAQIALKAQACAIGEKVVFAGSGPLLYLVAWQYLRAGVDVRAVLDAAPSAARINLLRAALQAPDIVARGLRFAAELRLRGTTLRSAVSDIRIEGDTRVAGVSWEERGRRCQLSCDAVGYGLGLRPETQLADLAGCEMRFDARDRAFLPIRLWGGRSSVSGVYLAGDGAGIVGADAAELSGERAALALIEDRGLVCDHVRAAAIDRRLSKISRLRDALEAAFPFRTAWAREIGDQTLICRCEEIDAGTMRRAIRDFDLSELNRVKAITRIGMGRCQGRVCAAAAAELLALEAGRGVDSVGRLRAQAPVKPLPLMLRAAQGKSEAAE